MLCSIVQECLILHVPYYRAQAAWSMHMQPTLVDMHKQQTLYVYNLQLCHARHMRMHAHAHSPAHPCARAHAQHSTAQRSTGQHSTAHHSAVQDCTEQLKSSAPQHSTARHNTADDAQ
jgi:hypothetical protein